MSASRVYEGRCHCRATGFAYRTAVPPSEWPMRACQCRFCRAHASLTTSDPAGFVEFLEHEPGALHRYRFGQRLADFLLCRHCGVYLGVVMRSGDSCFGIINARALPSLADALPEAVAMDYEDETESARSARRAARWTPAAALL